MTDRTTARVVVVVMVVVFRGRDMARLCGEAATPVKRAGRPMKRPGAGPGLGNLVERMGIEPTTSSMRTMRSPS